MPKSTRTPSSDMSKFQELLSKSKHVVAIAGAGLSAASGIPTFRGAGGLWRRYDAISLATPEAFEDNPSRVWQFYHYRREKALTAKPNAAHYALAAFSLPSVRHTIAPDATFTLITQNVDGLSKRALDDSVAAARGLPLGARPESTTSTASSGTGEGVGANDAERPRYLEMHGRLFDVRCTDANCGHTVYDTTSPVCDALKGTETFIADVGTSSEPEIAERDLPRCAKCGALARPGVVWFGETPIYLEMIDKLVDEADMCLVVGTSSTVFPAAGYAEIVKSHGGNVAVFNLEQSNGTKDADFFFSGPCENTLPEALGLQFGGKGVSSS